MLPTYINQKSQYQYIQTQELKILINNQIQFNLNTLKSSDNYILQDTNNVFILFKDNED